jgi:hypothetical protein
MYLITSQNKIMSYLNEVDAQTVQSWLNNFNNLGGNIYEPFQSDEIILKKTTWEAMCNHNMYHMHMYFGLDSEGKHKVIMTGAYELDAYDGDTGYADVLDPERVYELYSDSIISVNDAKDFIQIWENNNGSNPLYIRSFLMPRQNFIKLFVEDGLQEVKIFFGMDNNEEIHPMQTKPNSSGLVFNKASTCPPDCANQGL